MSKHFELMQQMEEERALVRQPAARALEPIARADEPLAKVAEPAARVSEPIAVAERPAAAVAEPAARGPEPDARSSGPAAIVAGPVARVEESAPGPVVQSKVGPSMGAFQRRWASAEASRLVQQVFLVHTPNPPRAVVFASIDHDNGCSEVCASVAEALAKDGRRRVCMVDANFRSPGLAELFGVVNDIGLKEALGHQRSIGSYAKRVSQDDLWLLSAGNLDKDSLKLLRPANLQGRLEELRREFDFVIIDAPPLSLYTDAVVLGQLADGVVMVLGADSTRSEAASQAAATLRSVNVPVLAAVLNKRISSASQPSSNRL